MSHRYRIRVALCAVLLMGLSACRLLDPPAPIWSDWTELLAGGSRGLAQSTAFGGEGEVQWTRDGVKLPAGSPLTGVHWTGVVFSGEDLRRDFPTEDYQLEVWAVRLEGTDFFCGLTVPVGQGAATLILGGWGGGLTGLSCVDGEDASTNPTRSFQTYVTGQEYHVRVEVLTSHIRCWVDGDLIVDQPREGHHFEVRPEVLLSQPLGVASYCTFATVRGLRLRVLDKPHEGQTPSASSD